MGVFYGDYKETLRFSEEQTKQYDDLISQAKDLADSYNKHVLDMYDETEADEEYDAWFQRRVICNPAKMKEASEEIILHVGNKQGTGKVS